MVPLPSWQYVAGSAVFAFALAYKCVEYALNHPLSKSPRIELGGTHEVRRAPELCDVYLRLRHESRQAGESMRLVSDATGALADRVRALAPAKAESEPRLSLDASDAADVPEEFPPQQPERPVTGWSVQQIRTWAFERTPPSRPSPDDDPSQYGRFFVAEASAKVTFHDFAELSAFVMAMSPVVSIDRLAWRLSAGTEKGLGNRVRQAALRDAIQKAENYAQVLDPRAASVTVVEINDGGGPGRAMYAMAASGRANSGQQRGVTIEPEPITVTANVHVKFDVKRA